MHAATVERALGDEAEARRLLDMAVAALAPLVID